MTFTHYKAGGLHNLAADFFKCSGAEVYHIDNIGIQQPNTQFFKTGKKHPSVLRNHRLITIFLCHLTTFFNKYSKQIALTIRIILLYIVVDFRPSIANAHIRRIRHNHIIFLCQCFCHLYQRQQLCQCHITGHIYIFCNLCKAVIQCRPVLRSYCQYRAVFLCIIQFADDRIHDRFQLGIPITEILHRKLVYMIALHNGIHMGLNATVEEPAVVLACFHHHCKVSQLCRTVINIQTIDVILHNTCHRFTGSIAIRFINLHQYIEHIRKDMTRTRAWVGCRY